MDATLASDDWVLVVDDDRAIRDSITSALQEAGYAVVTAGDGREALDCLARAVFLPRVILLDLMMPVMDGVEFRKRQLGSPDFATIPVVVFSADESGREKAASLAVKGFLRKPIRLAPLLALLERLCGPLPIAAP
jgi:CheY-like chemotaxis protein